MLGKGAKWPRYARIFLLSRREGQSFAPLRLGIALIAVTGVQPATLPDRRRSEK